MKWLRIFLKKVYVFFKSWAFFALNSLGKWGRRKPEPVKPWLSLFALMWY